MTIIGPISNLKLSEELETFIYLNNLNISIFKTYILNITGGASKVRSKLYLNF